MMRNEMIFFFYKEGLLTKEKINAELFTNVISFFKAVIQQKFSFIQNKHIHYM